MKKILILPFFLISFGLFSTFVLGCSCVTAEASEKDPAKMRTVLRDYYLNEFTGAIFTGSVDEIKQVKTNIDKDFYTMENEVVISVEKYWIGVKTQKVTLRTGIEGGDCGVQYDLKKRYFFFAQYIKGMLKTGICDYDSKYSMSADGPSVSAYDEILGPAKSFPAISGTK